MTVSAKYQTGFARSTVFLYIKEAKQSRYESYPAQHHQKPQPAPTVHSIMYQDIDRAVDAAKDLDDFYHILTQMGYRVKRDGKYPAISPEGHGFFRLYKFKEGYTEEDIRKRIAEKNRNPRQQQKPKPVYGAWRTPAEQQAYKKRYTDYYARRYGRRGLNATYLHYRYMLVKVRRQTYPRYPTIEQRKALDKLDKIHPVGERMFTIFCSPDQADIVNRIIEINELNGVKSADYEQESAREVTPQEVEVMTEEELRQRNRAMNADFITQFMDEVHPHATPNPTTPAERGNAVPSEVLSTSTASGRQSVRARVAAIRLGAGKETLGLPPVEGGTPSRDDAARLFYEKNMPNLSTATREI